MAQVQKESIRKLINNTALMLFATKGYRETSIADIAKTAGISVGNVYRYFKSKKEILDEIIPNEFISDFRERIINKIKTGKSETISKQRKDEKYILNSQEFLKFMISNRLRFLTLMKCNREGQFANFKEEILNYLVQLFMDNFVPEPNIQAEERATVTLLYQNFINLCTTVLSMDCDEAEMLEQLKKIVSYHVSGLAALVEQR